ncbi:MAG: hypothetical protein ABR906_06290 [Terracidiphilus sp.]
MYYPRAIGGFDASARRQSIYAHASRQALVAVALSLDLPAAASPCAARPDST